MLEFRILGPLEVVGDQGPLPLGGTKQRATLAILLLGANQVVSVERLAEDLYAGAPPVTAVKQVQRQISDLRKALGSLASIETRPPGYVLRLSREQLDLHRFERLSEEAGHALARGDAGRAADLFREALKLWRGAPLADLMYESFAQPSIARLEELRQTAVELRIDADLALGRHQELIAGLEQVVAEHPLRERARGQLMLALYRSGRQAEALDVYRRGRDALVEELGIEPTPALRELERQVLSQDPGLDLGRAAQQSVVALDRAVLLLSSDGQLQSLLRIAEPLTRVPGRELVIAHLVTAEGEVERAAAALNALRSSLDVRARIAAFTTLEPAADVVRLATDYDVDLVLLDAPPRLDADSVPGALAAVLERSPADVAVLAGSGEMEGGNGVFVPFGGGEHDWAALELAARLASTAGLPLRLVGTRAEPQARRRDASRLLADASLAVQRVVGVEAEPVLAEPTEQALVDAVQPATLVVAGISPRWRWEGIGSMRRALVRADLACPVLLVHRGPRPGVLAPQDTRTRFTWSIQAGS